jgi:hypothetical protein
LSIANSGWVILHRLTGVKGVANRFTNENQQRQQHRDGQKGGDAQPGRLQVVFPLQQLAERGRASGRPKPRKSSEVRVVMSCTE